MRTIRSMVEHAQWANARIIDALSSKSTEHPKILGLMAHIVQSEKVWLTRLQGEDSNTIALWDDLELAQCKETSESNAAAFEALLSSIQETELDRIVSYRNQSGKEYETSVRDILTHVAMHGQYHRGQINTLLTSEGREPVNVDMITYVREQ